MTIHAFLNPAVAPRSVRGAGNLSAIITACRSIAGSEASGWVSVQVTKRQREQKARRRRGPRGVSVALGI